MAATKATAPARLAPASEPATAPQSMIARPSRASQDSNTAIGIPSETSARMPRAAVAATV